MDLEKLAKLSTEWNAFQQREQELKTQILAYFWSWDQ